MRLTAQQQIRAGFGLLLILPTVLCIFAVKTIDTLIDSAEKVAQTDALLETLTGTLSDLKDMELHEREYILTGEEGFLAKYNDSRKAVDDKLKAIDKAIVGRKDLMDKVELLKTVKNEKFDEVTKTIELRRSGGIEAASDVIKNNL